MKYLKISLIVSILFILQGCIAPSTTINKSTYKQQVSSKIPHVEKSIEQNYTHIKTTKATNEINYNGSIKGVVQSIKYDKVKKSWLYIVQGIDTSHAKLPYARFYHDKKLASKGDLVYIILRNSSLQNLFFIKKANKITQKIKTTKKKKIWHKRNKSRETPWIGLPSVEQVTL